MASHTPATVAEALPIIRSQFSKLRICSAQDRVFKDECVLSFDSPYSDDGLYVNLVSWQGFGAAYVISDVAKGGVLYLHEKWRQVLVPKPEVAAPEAITKLAIGVDGGFQSTPDYEVVKEHKLIVVINSTLCEISLPCPDLPEFVNNVIDAIIKHEGMRPKLQVIAWEADNERFESKYARGLVQLNNGKKISQDPSTWKCEESGDTQNLWLNLSTGYIGGGRKNWDGSGGSGAALKHYEETGRQYPLCVKLGTITPHSADVWSYAADEDTLVIDPLLSEHLSHWGIDIMKLHKTDKSMAEADVALNMSYDWSKLMEGAEGLELVSGPGLIGLTNVGSTCYMNSVLQAMLTVPEIHQRYLQQRAAILSSTTSDPTADFATQFSKVCDGVYNARYAMPLSTEKDAPRADSEKYTVAPRMLKAIVGQGHAEFSSGRQQDASEYFMHLLQFMARAERTFLPRVHDTSLPTSSLFEFQVESRYECSLTGQVNYKSGKQAINNTLELRIPLDKAVNKSEVESIREAKKARTEAVNPLLPTADDEKLLVPFEDCLDSFFGAETVEYKNPSVGHLAAATRTNRLNGFPRYLLVKLARYYVGPNWCQVKIDARVPMPEQLDLGKYRATGLRPNEVPMPEEASNTSSSAQSATVADNAPPARVADEAIVAQLVSMGFSENGCRKAAMEHNDVEMAMNWIFAHMDDPDFNDPPVAVVASSGNTAEAAAAAGSSADEESVAMIVSMGYTEDQAKAALRATDNNLERAMDWIFSHADDLDTAVAMEQSGASSSSGAAATSSATPGRFEDDLSSNGQYSLVAIISHLGSNTSFGHYVCHVRRNGQWYLFNDDKVGKSTAAKAMQYGFLFLYARNDGPGTL